MANVNKRPIVPDGSGIPLNFQTLGNPALVEKMRFGMGFDSPSEVPQIVDPVLHCVYIGNGTSNATFGVHPHGFGFSGGNVSYNPVTKAMLTHTLVNSGQALNLVAGTKTFYTVTSGKTLFVTALIFSSGVAGTDAGQIKDSTTVVLPFYATQYKTEIYTFPGAPLKFTTSVVYQSGGAGAENVNLTIVGWEE